MSVALCDGREIAPSRNVSIYNNTICKKANRGPNHDQGDFFWLTGNVENMRVWNNIVYVENTDQDEPVILTEVDPRDLVDVLFWNNLYFVTPKPPQFGLFENGWASFAEWQGMGFDTGSSVEDPQFVSTDIGTINAETFLRLSAGSPAINSGGTPRTPYDADLQLRDGQIDKGAYEAP